MFSDLFRSISHAFAFFLLILPLILLGREYHSNGPEFGARSAAPRGDAVRPGLNHCRVPRGLPQTNPKTKERAQTMPEEIIVRDARTLPVSLRDPVLDLPTACRLLGNISIHTLRGWIQKGRVAGCKIGKRRMLRLSEVKSLIRILRWDHAPSDTEIRFSGFASEDSKPEPRTAYFFVKDSRPQQAK